MEHVASKDFEKLVKESVSDYWFLLAEALGSVRDREKKNLIKILQALYYYKSDHQTEVEEFDHMMTVIDFEEAEKDIIAKYSQIFN